MKYGFVFPYGDARDIAAGAVVAEQAGWDGIFVWEPVWGIDAWIALTAAAMKTECVRLGTLLSPISRMRPWKLASETATLDRLSNGRVILSVGLGAVDSGFANFGEVTDRKTRAELVDEGLDILDGLWHGQPFNYQGKHYQITETTFYPPPPPVQQPRIPIWMVGAWPHMKSMRRVLRCDGLLPSVGSGDGEVGQALLREIIAFIHANRTLTTPFDVIMEGRTPGDDPAQAAAQVRPWAAAGATWWIEALWGEGPPATQDDIRRRLEQGPPHVE